jgi:coatomer protein complex subunit gamma
VRAAPRNHPPTCCELRFASRVDPGTGEACGDAVPEVYPIDAVDVTPADFVAPTPVGDFRAAWEAAGADGEAVEQYALSFRTVADACAAVGDALGLAFCEGTAAVKPGATAHAAYLSGTFLGGTKVLARLQLKLAAADAAAAGVLLKVGIRCEDKDITAALLECIS